MEENEDVSMHGKFLEELEEEFAEELKEEFQRIGVPKSNNIDGNDNGWDTNPKEYLATRLWCSITNTEWVKEGYQPVYDGDAGGTTFRYAGHIIAEMSGNIDEMAYLDVFCSGPSGTVYPDIEERMAKRGWNHRPIS